MPYLENGVEVEVLAKFEGGFVVCNLIDDCDDEFRYGKPFIASKVWENPPLDRIHKSVDAEQAKLTEVRAQIDSSQKELKTITDSLKTMQDQIRLVPAIQRVYDFLVTGITHLAVVEYGEIKIIRIEDARSSEDDRYDRDLKLISLCGKTNGDLGWNLHRYSDGSGSWKQEIYPFTNESEAVEFAKKLIAERLESKEFENSRPTDSAKRMGVPIPEKLAKKIRDDQIHMLQQHMDTKESELNTLRQKLSELKGNL